MPLTSAQELAASRREGLRPAYQGYNFHQAVRDELLGRFRYSYRGPDFTQVETGIQFELTTLGQLAGHLDRYPWLTPDQVVTYTLP